MKGGKDFNREIEEAFARQGMNVTVTSVIRENSFDTEEITITCVRHVRAMPYMPSTGDRPDRGLIIEETRQEIKHEGW
jgi:hypothetical protein